MEARTAWIFFLTGAAVIGTGAVGAGQPNGERGARLRPCPDSPNCVSSLSTDPRHTIEPITFSGSAAVARKKLLKAIRSIPRSRLVSDQGNYFEIEFKSAIFRFVDDTEFLIDELNMLMHVRSSSRVGYWDLGVNRKRIEDIRRMMAQDASQETAP